MALPVLRRAVSLMRCPNGYLFSTFPAVRSNSDIYEIYRMDENFEKVLHGRDYRRRAKRGPKESKQSQSRVAPAPDAKLGEKPVTSDGKKFAFKDSVEKFNKLVEQKQDNFATIIRNSLLVQLGDPEGRMVIGKITEAIEDDLYIDFGGKFHCVCQRPKSMGERYVRGAKVILQLIDLELSSKFLGAVKHITLLEADAKLVGLYDPSRR